MASNSNGSPYLECFAIIRPEGTRSWGSWQWGDLGLNLLQGSITLGKSLLLPGLQFSRLNKPGVEILCDKNF